MSRISCFEQGRVRVNKMTDKTEWVHLGPNLLINAKLMARITYVKIEYEPLDTQLPARAEIHFAEGMSVGQWILSGNKDIAAFLRWLAETL